MVTNESISDDLLGELCRNAFTDNEFEQQVSRYSAILPHTDEALHKPCRPVDMPFIESGEIFPLVMMMRSHLEENNGLGLAANQVGSDRRIILMKYENNVVIMVNPIIGLRRGKHVMVEKCLSVHEGRTGYAVKRAKTINVKFDTFREVDGEAVLGEASGKVSQLAAVVFQHEVDHLNGLSIVDKGKLVSEPNKELA